MFTTATEALIIGAGIPSEAAARGPHRGNFPALHEHRGLYPRQEVGHPGFGGYRHDHGPRLTLEGASVGAVLEIILWPGGLIRNEVQCLHDSASSSWSIR